MTGLDTTSDYPNEKTEDDEVEDGFGAREVSLDDKPASDEREASEELLPVVVGEDSEEVLWKPGDLGVDSIGSVTTVDAEAVTRGMTVLPPTSPLEKAAASLAESSRKLAVSRRKPFSGWWKSTSGHQPTTTRGHWVTKARPNRLQKKGKVSTNKVKTAGRRSKSTDIDDLDFFKIGSSGDKIRRYDDLLQLNDFDDKPKKKPFGDWSVFVDKGSALQGKVDDKDKIIPVSSKQQPDDNDVNNDIYFMKPEDVYTSQIYPKQSAVFLPMPAPIRLRKSIDGYDFASLAGANRRLRRQKRSIDAGIASTFADDEDVAELIDRKSVDDRHQRTRRSPIGSRRRRRRWRKRGNRSGAGVDDAVSGMEERGFNRRLMRQRSGDDDFDDDDVNEYEKTDREARGLVDVEDDEVDDAELERLADEFLDNEVDCYYLHVILLRFVSNLVLHIHD